MGCLLVLSSWYVAADDGEYMVIIHRLYAPQLANVEKSCVVVYPDGRFRLEVDSAQSTDAKQARVFRSTLGSDQLSSLKQALADEELKVLRTQANPMNYVTRDFDMIALRIRRNGDVQQLIFTNPDGKSRFPKSVVAVENWFKTLKKSHLPQDRTTQGNRCAAF